MKFRDLINKTAIKILTPFCRPGSSPDKTLIMFAGHSYGGNLKSLYEELRTRATFNDIPFRVYWVVKKRKNLKRFRTEKIDVLWYYGIKNIPNFLKARVWLNDRGTASIPVAKQPGSFWVQAGHAIPFKSSAGDEEVRQELEKFDFNPVSSEWFRNYYVKGIGISPEKVAVTGYPRIDRLLKPGYYSREQILGQLFFRPDQPVIMYAPTWEQENKEGEPLFPFGDDRKFIKELEAFLEKNRMQLIIRLHPKWKGWVPRSARFGQENGLTNLKFCSARTDWDTEKYLYVTDVLVTDWSSIANDFLVLDRPIVFIDKPPKFFYYGYVIQPEERPGAIVKTEKELFAALIKSVAEPNEHAEKRRILKEKVHFGLDGQASSRTITAMENRLER
ncbi:MAG: CDP-glycerol glycerophosphotransferase family protein [Candidatus Ratteibacteria bacterium]|jgi:CDP-glycerol glycerophosphotransferase (TagB/SpsB family)